MSIRRHVVLMDQSAAGSSPWIQLDSRYEDFAQRVIQGNVVAGDTINIEGTTRDVRGPDKSFLTTLPASDIALAATYTADFDEVLNGNFAFIRITKVGTTGNSKVQGNI